MSERVLKERYAIQQQLGQNGGRQTLLARDLQTQELVVIKILTFDADCQWDDVKLFEREAEALQSLSHPAIPRYLDHFQFQTSKIKGFALVQNYIAAKSLTEWVKLGRTFNQKDIQQLAASLLEILMYLHRQHPPVIHRDIKPSNILLGDRSGNSIGRVYLVDFGSIQTLAAREGSTITVVGTYGYMPPEQFGGRAVPASDLYGLGATLIYLLTGTHPADLPQKDLRIKFKPKIHLTSDFLDWLEWMTEPDLNRRLTSAEKALKALKKPCQRNGKYPVIQKFVGGKFQLNKEPNSLEIIIPFSSQTWQTWIVISCLSVLFICLVLPFFSIGIVLMYLMVYTSKNWGEKLLLVLMGIFLVSLFALLVGIIIKIFPESTRLRIDRSQISLTNRPSSPRWAISQLGIIAVDRTNSRLHRNIQIWAGAREYQLPTKNLSDLEVDWIAQELSEWLDIPIT
jgi:serine/threonine protein kinase